MKKKLRGCFDERGFTLVELVVVIAILGVLAGIITPLMMNWSREAKGSAANATAKSVRDIYSNFATHLMMDNAGFMGMDFVILGGKRNNVITHTAYRKGEPNVIRDADFFAEGLLMTNAAKKQEFYTSFQDVPNASKWIIVVDGGSVGQCFWAETMNSPCFDFFTESSSYDDIYDIIEPLIDGVRVPNGTNPYWTGESTVNFGGSFEATVGTSPRIPVSS